MDESKRLRVLLDKRGIEWKDNDTPINGVTSYMTTWHCTNGKLVSFIETEIPHATKLRIYNPTHEQAIAATVGVGTCVDKDSDPNDFKCSACGAHSFIQANDTYTTILDDHLTVLKKFNYCPNCGKRIEVDE